MIGRTWRMRVVSSFLLPATAMGLRSAMSVPTVTICRLRAAVATTRTACTSVRVISIPTTTAATAVGLSAWFAPPGSSSLWAKKGGMTGEVYLS